MNCSISISCIDNTIGSRPALYDIRALLPFDDKGELMRFVHKAGTRNPTKKQRMANQSAQSCVIVSAILCERNTTVRGTFVQCKCRQQQQQVPSLPLVVFAKFYFIFNSEGPVLGHCDASPHLLGRTNDRTGDDIFPLELAEVWRTFVRPRALRLHACFFVHKAVATRCHMLGLLLTPCQPTRCGV